MDDPWYTSQQLETSIFIWCYCLFENLGGGGGLKAVSVSVWKSRSKWCQKCGSAEWSVFSIWLIWLIVMKFSKIYACCCWSLTVHPQGKQQLLTSDINSSVDQGPFCHQVIKLHSHIHHKDSHYLWQTHKLLFKVAALVHMMWQFIITICSHPDVFLLRLFNKYCVCTYHCINCGTFSVWHIHYNCASLKVFEADPPWLTGAYPKLTAQLQNVNVKNKEEIWTFGMKRPSAATTIYFIWLSIQYNTTLLSLCREVFFLARHLYKNIQYS